MSEASSVALGVAVEMIKVGGFLCDQIAPSGGSTAAKLLSPFGSSTVIDI